MSYFYDIIDMLQRIRFLPKKEGTMKTIDRIKNDIAKLGLDVETVLYNMGLDDGNTEQYKYINGQLMYSKTFVGKFLFQKPFGITVNFNDYV